MDDGTRYVVWNENTLGYIHASRPQLMGVLAGNVHGRNWIDGPVIICSYDRVVDATVADFERFRVHIPSNYMQAR